MRDELLKQAKAMLRYRRNEGLAPFDYYPCVKHYRTLLRRLSQFSDDELLLMLECSRDKEWWLIDDLNDELKQFADYAWEDRIPTVIYRQ